MLFLLHLGCARNVPEPKPSLDVCDAWKGKVVLHGALRCLFSVSAYGERLL